MKYIVILFLCFLSLIQKVKIQKVKNTLQNVKGTRP